MIWLFIAVALIATLYGAPWLWSKARSLKLPSLPKVSIGNPLQWKVPLLPVVVLAACAGAAVVTQRGCSLSDLPAITIFQEKPTAVTYVYEKDDTAIPDAVEVAFDKLNRQGIVATKFEQDTKDGTGEIPEQYKAALAAAKQSGLPSLVATAGASVIRVVKAPTTEAQVLEAAR